MKIFALIVLALLVAASSGFLFLAQKSKSGKPQGLVNGALAACPSSPNCVSSEDGTPDNRGVDPFPVSAWERLSDVIAGAGGVITETREDYIAAEFSSKLMGFVDDVEFRKGDDAVHVRSASRVGYSDRGVNRKRVEALRAALTE